MISHPKIHTCYFFPTASPSIRLHVSGKVTLSLEKHFVDSKPNTVEFLEPGKTKPKTFQNTVKTLQTKSQAEDLHFRIQILKLKPAGKAQEKNPEHSNVDSTRAQHSTMLRQHLMTIYSANLNDFMQLALVNSTMLHVTALIGNKFKVRFKVVTSNRSRDELSLLKCFVSKS